MGEEVYHSSTNPTMSQGVSLGVTKKSDVFRKSTVESMSTRSAVYHFLHEHQMWDRQSDPAKQTIQRQRRRFEDAECTHGIMSGLPCGAFKVPPNKEMDFLAAYQQDIMEGHRHYLIERRAGSAYFKLHCDFDIKRPDPLPDDVIRSYIQHYIQIVRESYDSAVCPPAMFDCLVCLSRTPGKVGIHPVFFNLLVTAAHAIDIRSRYISHMISLFGESTGGQNPWDDIVDISVYKKNGLRMLGSRKCERCKVCQGTSKGDCPGCFECRGHKIGRAHV